MDEVIQRIRKLMALTEGRGCSEAEAALAASHVQRLLAEHNLSMAAVAVHSASDRTRGEAKFRQVYKWQRRLMKALGETNYCTVLERTVFLGADGKPAEWGKPVFDGYDLIGRIDNVATTRLMFEYLLQAIDRLAKEFARDPLLYFTRATHSFREGCADRLIERVKQRYEALLAEQEAEAKARPPSNGSSLPALILRDVMQDEKDLNEDYRLGLEPGTTGRERQEAKLAEERRRAEASAREAALIAAGYGKDVAWYMARGWSEVEARRACAPRIERPQTARDRAREEAAERAYHRRAYAQQVREGRRLDRGAYDRGHASGANVGLDRQVGENLTKRLV